MPPRLARDRIRPLDLTHAHAASVADLPPHHPDPFDRLLVAQARCEGLTLVTADPGIRAHDVSISWVGG